MNFHLDTHVALWMVAGDKKRLRPAQRHIRGGSLFVSPVALLEMEVLREIGRIRASVDTILDILVSDHGVEEASGDLGEVARHARSLGWTRDPFDRLIVAHALAKQASLLTADETIRGHCPFARWD
ncbi:MAG: type II toxin-antitoxin system VapC family toxin [Deltaproteobacteria bacterium]|nr:type II toxin-antitoxin system VapC family toxin [Deltaproteobacteria bacterium]